MNHAETCPVCGGKGTVLPPPNYEVTSAQTEQACHGCGGRGWVTVPGPDSTPIDISPPDGWLHQYNA